MIKKELKAHYMILFSHHLVMSLGFFLLPLYFLEIGFNGFQSGLLMGLFTLMGLIFSFYVGIKTDSVNERRMITLGMILFALFFVGLSYLSNFWMLIGIFALGGLGHLIIKRSSETFVYRATEKKKKGVSIATLNVIWEIPSIVGVIVGAYIIERIGFVSLFKIGAIGSVLILFLALKVKKNEVFKFSLEDYLGDINNKKVLYFCLIIFIFTLHWGAEYVAYTPFLHKGLGLSIVQISYFMTGVLVFLIMGGIAGGILVDKGFNEVKMFNYSMLLSGIGGVMFASTSNVLASFLWRMVHEIGDGVFILLIGVGIINLFEKERIGGNAGFVHLIPIIATVIGSFIFGPIGYKFGFHLPHIISGALSIVAFFMIMLFVRKKK